MRVLLQIGGEIYNPPWTGSQLFALVAVVTGIIVYFYAPSRNGLTMKDKSDLLVGWLILILSGLFLVGMVQSLVQLFSNRDNKDD